jgi:RND family efflux transporter MFP subunit
VVSVIVSLKPYAARGYVGSVTSFKQVELGFPLEGTLIERAVDLGDSVATGAALARLDPEDFAADLRAAEGGVAVAEARLRNATDTAVRARELADRGADSVIRADQAERDRVAAEAGLEQALAARVRAADALGLAVMAAPFDAVVTSIMAEPGTALSMGQPVLALAGVDAREVVIDVTEADAARLAPGTPFAVALMSNPAVAARAVFDRADPVSDRQTRTRRLHLALADPPASFRLGALVTVRPEIDAEGLVFLPVSALLDPPAVWRIERPGNVIRQVPVETGPATDGYVAIAKGLAPGDEVMIRGIHSVEEGQRVGPRVSE